MSGFLVGRALTLRQSRPNAGIPFRSPRSCPAGRRESPTGGTASLPPGRVPGGYPEEPAAPTRHAGNQVVGIGRMHQDLPVFVAATPLPRPRPSFTGHDGGLLVSMRGPTTPGASMTYADADSTGAMSGCPTDDADCDLHGRVLPQLSGCLSWGFLSGELATSRRRATGRLTRQGPSVSR